MKTTLSLSKIIQTKAILYDNEPRSFIGKASGRIIVVIIKTPALIIDIFANIVAGNAKIAVRLLVIMPINFAAKVLGKKGIDSDWTIKQGLFHFGCAGLYTWDIFHQLIINLIGPEYYLISLPFICDAYVDCNLVNRQGRTPLQIAYLMKKFDLVEKLVNAGANTTQTDEFGETLAFQLKYSKKKNYQLIILVLGLLYP